MANLKFPLLLCSLFILGSISAKGETVKDVIKKPKKYKGEEVTLKGTASLTSDSSMFYLLEDGDSILVKSVDDEISKNKKYKVTGDVISRNDSLFIAMGNLECINCNAEDEEEDESSLLYILIGLAGLVLIMLLVLLFRKRKPSPPATAPASAGYNNTSNRGPRPPGGMDDGFSTISFDRSALSKTPSASPGIPAASAPSATQAVPMQEHQKPQENTTTNNRGTVRLIPGKFKILSGKSKGKELRVTGQPSSLGSIASIGREDAKGGDGTHIKLDDPTISRRQAEIREFERQVMIKNIGSTNPTLVNGTALGVGEEAVLQNGTTIKMGDIELQYSI